MPRPNAPPPMQTRTSPHAPMHAATQGDQTHNAAEASADEVDAIVARGPGGAFAVAGIATLLVVAMFFLFYVFAYLPRGVVQ